MTDQEKYKLIERTSKYDAYFQLHIWGKTVLRTKHETDHDHVLWYTKEKMNDRKEWSSQQPFRYDFVNGFIPNDGYYETRDLR